MNTRRRAGWGAGFGASLVAIAALGASASAQTSRDYDDHSATAEYWQDAETYDRTEFDEWYGVDPWSLPAGDTDRPREDSRAHGADQHWDMGEYEVDTYPNRAGYYTNPDRGTYRQTSPYAFDESDARAQREDEPRYYTHDWYTEVDILTATAQAPDGAWIGAEPDFSGSDDEPRFYTEDWTGGSSQRAQSSGSDWYEW